MFKKALLQTDLTPTQAEILDFLYQNKEAKASVIAKKIQRSRAIVYKELEELTDLGIVEKDDKPNQVSIFRANHPAQLEKLMEIRENKLKKDKELLNNYLPDMISAFNLMNNKPGIKFYEGIEGVKKILNDTLKAKDEIYTISDSSSIRAHAKKLNEEYIKKRKKLGIKKKLIVPLSARDNYSQTKTEFTEIRFLPGEYFNFDTGIQIYDGKISYQTIKPDKMVGVLIENESIYKMHKMLFEYIWDSLAKNKEDEKEFENPYFNKNFIA